MAEENQPLEILELTTVRQRQTIKIDGISYDLLDLDELELDEYLELEFARKKFRSMDRGKLTREQAKDIKMVVGKLSRFMLPSVPEKIFKKLTPAMKMAIVGEAQAGAATDFFEKITTRAKAKGRSSSPDSNGSTGARRGTGKK